ncbi:MAG: hypothetical protein EXS38_05145 [Opitutus sp.]|nr:hypothetical protein [Opitutus sp.]
MEQTKPRAGRGPRFLRPTIAALLIFTGLGLASQAVRTARQRESVNEMPVIAPITDAADLAMRRRDVVGTFATGDQPGDRVIAIDADGRVNFFQIDAKGRTAPETDTYQLGRRARNSCLTTTASGTLELLDIDTLEYYRDRYHRTK